MICGVTIPLHWGTERIGWIEITREEYERQEALLVSGILRYDIRRTWAGAFWAWLLGEL